MTPAITPTPPSATASRQAWPQELTEPARVGAMFRDTTRGSSRASASCATSRPLASCAADDVRGAHHPAARTDADGPNSDGLGRGMTVLDAVSCRSSVTDRTRHET